MRRRRLLAAAAGLGTLGLAGGATLAVRRPTRRNAARAPSATGRGSSGDRGPGDPPVPRDVELPLPRSAFERGAARDAIPALVDPAFAPDWTGLSVPVDDQFGRRTVRPRLADTDPVVGVLVGEVGDAPGADDAGDGDGPVARAYPLRVLVHHEVVNDVAGGRPLAVTYCPLCASGLVVDRRVPTPEARPTADRSPSPDGASSAAGGPAAGRPATGDGSGPGSPSSPITVAAFGVSGLLWRDNLVLYR